MRKHQSRNLLFRDFTEHVNKHMRKPYLRGVKQNPPASGQLRHRAPPPLDPLPCSSLREAMVDKTSSADRALPVPLLRQVVTRPSG